MRAPICVIAGEFDFVALNPVCKFERACTDWRLFNVTDGFRCYYNRVAPCEVEQEVAVWRVQGDNDGCCVQCADICDAGKQCFLRICAVVSTGAVQRELNVFSVHGATVVEQNIVMQDERVNQTVI